MFDFIDGGAENELTQQRNRRAVESLTMTPRVLTGVTDPDLGCTLLGRRRPSPFVLAPTGFTRSIHSQGEAAVARAASRHGVPFTLSSSSNTSIEAVAAGGDGPFWFGLYPWRDRGISLNQMERAKASGYEALVLTVDVPVAGNRLRDLRNGFSVPPRLGLRTVVDGIRHPAWSWNFVRGEALSFANVSQRAVDTALTTSFANLMFDPILTWDDLSWYREAWDGPFVLKGLLHPQDVARAAKLGFSAAVISNHGGRQLGAAPATVHALQRVRDVVGDDIELLVDSGFRRGHDIVAALALGASGVLLGRSYLYGLGAGGEQGVERVVALLLAEIRRTLVLLGVSGIEALTPDLVGGGR